MFKSLKFRLYPTDEQKIYFIKAIGSSRFVFNKALEFKTKHYKETDKNLSRYDLQNGLLIDLKKQHEWLNEPYSQSLQSSIGNLDIAFKKFFKGESAFPKFKSRHDNRQSVEYPQGIRVNFKNNKTTIPKCGLVKTVFDRKFEGKIKTCTISKTPTNKFYISIVIDDGKELPGKPKIKEETSVGVDLGITHFAILSNEEKIGNQRFLEKDMRRLKILQKRTSNKKKGSNNQKKANLKVAKLHEKIANKRKDFQQKLSTKIIRDNQTIIVENLNITGMVKNHKLAKNISSVGWGEFVRQLKYKSEWYGKNLITIGRFDPSSKMCSCCAVINKELKLSDRYWACEACNIVHDRDINAAINIKNFGLLKAKSGQEMPAGLVEMSASKANRRSKKSVGIIV